MSPFPSPSLLSALTTNTGATVGACAILAAAVMVSATQLTMPGKDDGAVRVASSVATSAQPASQALPLAAPIDPKVISPEQRKAVEQIVREYLLANPDILVDVSKALEERERQRTAAMASAAIKDKTAEIFRSADDFVLGNPNGDITVVEFFDYNCGWCKRAVDELTKLTKSDPKIRVVLKELPIFGENSTIAAKAAMASIAQGKYWEFHVALMKERQVSKDNVFTIAQKVGLDVAASRPTWRSRSSTRCSGKIRPPRVRSASREPQASSSMRRSTSDLRLQSSSRNLRRRCASRAASSVER